ncbi:hypothetical protein SCD_n03048 (plasmid) [Sulfuricella denitrificans skB26]|uniref:Uncharacterized protein n=1 Tax=Sulfuricella denitrificans (strain DSM 22764 / NBRC 105220 / skB26) TaxID=1163617 RepID=S6B949_SULDS|nr:hypothetical protein SCD_n03048 [Sulfuricella denitrificans skB26]
MESLTADECATFQKCRETLSKLAGEANQAKSEVKRHAAEKLALQTRLHKEAHVAVAAAFPVQTIEDAIVFLAWDTPLKNWQSTHWQASIKNEITGKSYRKTPDVLAESKNQAQDLIREFIRTIAFEAESKSIAVTEIISAARSDLDSKQPLILAKMERFIQEIRAAAVAQSLDKANQH